MKDIYSEKCLWRREGKDLIMMGRAFRPWCRWTLGRRWATENDWVWRVSDWSTVLRKIWPGCWRECLTQRCSPKEPWISQDGPALHPHSACQWEQSTGSFSFTWWWTQRGGSWVGSLVNCSPQSISEEHVFMIITPFPLPSYIFSSASPSSSSEHYTTFGK